MNQEQVVLEYLKAKGCITSIEAVENLGITRLSAKIYNLRKKSYDIVTERKYTTNRYNNFCSYGEYQLRENKE